MDTYIVRVFRRSEQNPEEVSGTLEHIESGETQTFRDIHKLTGIIAQSGMEGRPPDERP